MIVKITPGTQPVSARLTVIGPVHWAYLLSSPDHTYKKSGTSNAPNDMDLGVPSDLQLDPHEWTIHLANMTASEVSFEAVLEFRQGGNVLAPWSKGGRLKPGEESILDDKTVLMVAPSSATTGGI